VLSQLLDLQGRELGDYEGSACGLDSLLKNLPEALLPGSPNLEGGRGQVGQ
jgi:hypothetical protein